MLNRPIKAKPQGLENPLTRSSENKPATPTTSVPTPKYHVNMLPDNCRYNNIHYAYPGYEYDMRVLKIPGVRVGPKAVPYRETAVSAQVKESSEERQMRKIRNNTHTIIKLVASVLVLLWAVWKGV